MSLRLPVLSVERLALLAFTLVLVANGLGAYDIGPIPVQWLGMLLAIGTAAVLGLEEGLYYVPGTGALGVLIAWAVLVTAGSSIFVNYAAMMPRDSTTPYAVYVGLRFMVLFSFLSTIYLVYWLLRRGYAPEILRLVVRVGALVALAAVYIYFAQIYHLPEPPRSRMGTAGGEQAVTFTYAFHRATGTFREPSHLAEWLIAPLFLSLVYRRRALNLASVSMAAALLLTGSLTGIMGGLAGFLGAVVVTNPFRGRKLRLVLQLAGMTVVAGIIFRLVVVSNFSGGVDLFAVISDRLEPILMTGGLTETDRGYIYEYLRKQRVPLVGVGMGHANLQMSAYFHAKVVVSFINLYASMLYSLGVVGVCILAVFLLAPVAAVVGSRELSQKPLVLGLLAGYLGWLVMFAVHSEEFSALFAIVFGILAFLRKVPEAAGQVDE